MPKMNHEYESNSWISVKDALPTESFPVYVYMPSNKPAFQQWIAILDENKVWRDLEIYHPDKMINYDGRYDNITHWRPFLHPPVK